MLQAVAVLSFGLAAVASAPPALATSPPAAEWPQFRGGPTHTGSDVASTITPANVGTLDQAWHADIGLVMSSPAVVGGVVYVGKYSSTGDGPAGLDAFPATCPAASSCAPLWTGPTTGNVAASPAVAGGVAYLGSVNGTLYAFDAAGVQGCSGIPKSCAPLWTAATGDSIESSAAVAGGRVYVGSYDNSLYAFDAAGSTNCTGVPKTCLALWTGATGGDIVSSPPVSGGVTYVESDDGKVYAFDAAGVTNCSGSPVACTPLWTATLGGFAEGSPTVANGVLYVSANAGVFAFDAAGATNCSGSPKICAPLWSAATGALFASPAVAGGRVYVAGFDRKLYAFDAAGATNCSGVPKTCTPLWTALTSTVTGAEVISSPAVANGLVFVGTGIGDHYLQAYDGAGVTKCTGTPKTCTPVWSGDTGTSMRSSPAVAGDYVYVGTDGDGLLAFGLPATGAGSFHPLSPVRIYDSRTRRGRRRPR